MQSVRCFGPVSSFFVQRAATGFTGTGEYRVTVPFHGQTILLRRLSNKFWESLKTPRGRPHRDTSQETPSRPRIQPLTDNSFKVNASS